MGIISVLKLPFKLLIGLLGKRRKRVKNKLAEKQRKHIQNFDPSRLKNRSWQKSLGKSKKKKLRKWKKDRKLVKKRSKKQSELE